MDTAAAVRSSRDYWADTGNRKGWFVGTGIVADCWGTGSDSRAVADRGIDSDSGIAGSGIDTDCMADSSGSKDPCS